MQRRRTRRTSSQWSDIVNQFHASGQSQEAFCGANALALTTFQKYRRLARRQQRCSNKGTGFVDITPSSPTEGLRPSSVLHAGGGVSVHCAPDMDIATLARLVRAVRDGC